MAGPSNKLPTKEDLTQKLEQERLSQIKNAAWSMKGELVAGGRCPKCTLKPPCKHYDTLGAILNDPAALPAAPIKKSPKKLAARGDEAFVPLSDYGNAHPEGSPVKRLPPSHAHV